MVMHSHYQDQEFRTQKAVRSGLSQPQELSGLTKVEAEELLDCLEAAGYERCLLSYVHNQRFTVRWQSGTKRTPSGNSHHPELRQEQNPVSDADTLQAVAGSPG